MTDYGPENHARLRHVPLDDSEAQAIRQQAAIKGDAKFQAAMNEAIAAGLEQAVTGVSTKAGTKQPRYVSDITAKYHRPVD
jgi:hypothetical protein